MSAANVAELVKKGRFLHQKIEFMTRELDEVEEQLKAAALEGDQVDLVDENREGKQFLAQAIVDLKRVTVPVVITSDLLATQFADRGQLHDKLRDLAYGKLSALFHPKTVWESLYKSGKQLRQAAHEVLGEEAPAFITALRKVDKHGIARNQVRVEWDRLTEEAL